jgi:hypothetical protein
MRDRDGRPLKQKDRLAVVHANRQVLPVSGFREKFVPCNFRLLQHNLPFATKRTAAWTYAASRVTPCFLTITVRVPQKLTGGLRGNTRGCVSGFQGTAECGLK